MIPSIRTFLLINLLLSVTLIISLAIIGNLFLAHKDIQNRLDNQLIETSFRIQAFFSGFSGCRGKESLSIVQKKLNKQPYSNINKKAYKTPFDKKMFNNTVEFQIWSPKRALILHSKKAPKISFLKNHRGLSTLWLNNHKWRINTIYDPKTKLTIMVAERLNYRQQLETQLTQDSIFIMLVTYPFLGLLIWFIVGRGLNTLKRFTHEIRHRAPSNLKPVDLESAPSEIEPLVTELNNLFIRLQEAFNREKRFTADAAHELKTPLAALSTQTQVALRAETTEARNQALLKVLTGVNRSTHVVQQLLTLSRMVPEASINEPTKVSVIKQTSDVAALLAPEAIAKNIDLELIIPNSKATILGNATAINILIRNLVDNAIRYTHEHGIVKINIFDNRNEVILQIIDNGPGIPKELHQRVFERFFRIIGNKTMGSGLGLGIVQQIVKLHHAKIQLKTSPTATGLEVEVIFPKNFNTLK